MKEHQAAFVVWLIAAALMPAVVSAQGGTAPPPELRRPYRGLFTGLSTPRTPQSLVFSASLFGAYDDNVLAGLTESAERDWWLQESGFYTGAHAGLEYAVARTGQRVNYGAQAGGELRYYRNSEFSNVAPQYHAGADMSVALSRSTRLSMGHQFAYVYSYRFFGVPPFAEEETVDEGLIVTDPALDLFQLPAFRNMTDVSLTHELGRHLFVGVGYGFRAVDFVDNDEPDDVVDEPDEVLEDGHLRDYASHSGRALIHYDRPLSSHATLNLGYGIRVSDGQNGTGEPRIMHDVRAGVSYGRALSFSRRTSLSFGTGSALAASEDLNQPDSELRTHFRLTGKVDLVHELGRTWTARAGYYRGFVFREGYNEPYFTDGATAGIGGLITRRLSFSTVAMWSMSSLQREGRTDQNSVSATAQSTYALNSFLALFANYVYYKYDVQEDVPLDPRFPRNLNRQGVRVGISTSIPLIR